MATTYPPHSHPDDVSIDTFFDADQLIQHDDVDSLDSHQSSGAHSPSSSRLSHFPNDFILDQHGQHPAWPLAGQHMADNGGQQLPHASVPFFPLAGHPVKMELDDAGLPVHESMWPHQHQQSHHLHLETPFYPQSANEASYPLHPGHASAFDPYRAHLVSVSGPTIAPTAVESVQSPFSTEMSFNSHASSLPTSPDRVATASQRSASASVSALSASQQLQAVTMGAAGQTVQASEPSATTTRKQTAASKKRKVETPSATTVAKAAPNAVPSATSTSPPKAAEKVKTEDDSIDSDLSQPNGSNESGPRSESARSVSPPEVSTRPLPAIDTSAPHSSLFVHPDTSGLSKRDARLVKNRAAAFLSRQRKREEFGEMEKRCKALEGVISGWWEGFGQSEGAAHQAAEVVAARGEDAIAAVEYMLSNAGVDVTSFQAAVAAAADTVAGRSVAPLPSGGTKAASGQKRTRDSSVTPSQQAEVAKIKEENMKLRNELEAAHRHSAHLAVQLDGIRKREEEEALRHVTHSLSSASMAPTGQGPFLSGAPASSTRPPQSESQLSFPPQIGGMELGEADGLYRTSFSSEGSNMLFNPAALPFMVPDDLEGARGQLVSMASTASHSRNSSISSHATSPTSSNGHLVGTAAGNPKKAAGGMALMAILFSFALFGMPAGTGPMKGIEIGRSDIANENLASLGRVISSLSSGTTLRSSLQPRRAIKRRSTRIAASQDKEHHDDQASISDDEMYDAEENLDGEVGTAVSAPSSHLSEADLDANLPEELASSEKLEKPSSQSAAKGDSATTVMRWWEQTLLAATTRDATSQNGAQVTAATAELDANSAALLDALDLSSIGGSKQGRATLAKLPKGSDKAAASSVDREQISRDLSTYLGDSLRLLSVKRGPVSEAVDQSKAAFILVGSPYADSVSVKRGDSGDSPAQEDPSSDGAQSPASKTTTPEDEESPTRFTLFLPTPAGYAVSSDDASDVTDPDANDKTMLDAEPTMLAKKGSGLTGTPSQPASQRISPVMPTNDVPSPPHLGGDFLQLEFSLDPTHMWRGEEMHGLLRSFSQ